MLCILQITHTIFCNTAEALLVGFTIVKLNLVWKLLLNAGVCSSIFWDCEF